MKLALDTLDRLPESASRPNYGRAELSPGIVHFGVGNFHRAHQTRYLDALFNTGLDHDWAIVGAGVMPTDAEMRTRLLRQDLLSTVVEQAADGAMATVTGAMIGFADPLDKAATIAALADPHIRLVTLTVTEGGYFISPASGAFDPDDPAIRHDARHLSEPATVFGLLAAGLKRRRQAGIAPFTVLSCDNVRHNGRVAREAVVGLAAQSDPGLADWIDNNVAFPSSMVDRITPATGPAERTRFREMFGFDDVAPVFCEDFIQWVVEDDFCAGRPRLEEVGVQFVTDVEPFETMKIRILNGGHAAVGYPAGVLGIELVDRAMENPLIRGFLEKLERTSILPTVPPVPGTDLEAYLQQIFDRLSNPNVGDTVWRLCLDGSNRQPKFVEPTIAALLNRNMPVDGIALISAFWCRYCYGVDEAGNTYDIPDEAAGELQALAQQAKDDPLAFLRFRKAYSVVGDDLRFREAFAANVQAIWKEGTESVIKQYLAA